MTDNEIIKSLECCITNDCAKCKAYDETNGEIVDCLHAICRNAIDLINQQKAEIERLNVELVGMRGACESYKMHYDNAQAEIERLNILIKKADEHFSEGDFAKGISIIINLVKEMVGDNNE